MSFQDLRRGSGGWQTEVWRPQLAGQVRGSIGSPGWLQQREEAGSHGRSGTKRRHVTQDSWGVNTTALSDGSHDGL